MALTLDHIVILVEDLDAAIADYAQLGFTVQPGGTHADGNTHNALVGFDDGSYLELIAFLRPAPLHRWGAAAARGTEGFVDWALLPGKVDEAVQAARDRGLAYAGPIDGGRVRPDGERLRWQIGTPPSAGLPFLCGDVTPRALRVPEGRVRKHANGVLGVASITVVVSDLDASLARYRALLGEEATRGAAPFSAAGLGLRQALVPLGATSLVLVGPGPDEEASANVALRRVLAARGEGVIGLALSSGAVTAPQSLPWAQTHGASFDVLPA